MARPPQKLRLKLWLLLALAVIMSPAQAKVTTGMITLGPKGSGQQFSFLAKFGYAVGEGQYRARFKAIRYSEAEWGIMGGLSSWGAKDGAASNSTATQQEEPEVVDIPLSIFLDEDWEEYGVDRMEPECDRIKHEKSNRSIQLPYQKNKVNEWSPWETGNLYQNVRAHVWYFAVHNCNGSLPDRTRLKFEFEHLQHDDCHFSYEMRGMWTVYSVKLVLYAVYALYYAKLCWQFKESAEKLHAVIWVLSAAIFMQVIGTFLHWAHLTVYSWDGVGFRALDVFNEICIAISQVLLQSLLILISLGYMLKQKDLGDLDIVIPVVFIILILNILLVGFAKVKDDASFKWYENEGSVGLLMSVVRLGMWGWFIYGVRTLKQTASLKLQTFLTKFAIIGSLYFLSFPFMHLFVQLWAPYLRHPVMTIGLYLSWIFSVKWMEGLFLKRGEFFRLSSMNSTFLPSPAEYGHKAS